MTGEPRMTEGEARALVAAHGLPPIAVRLLVTMFRNGPECRRSLEDLEAEGFTRRTLPVMLRALVNAGLVQRERGGPRGHKGKGSSPDIYRLLVGEAPQ